MSEFHRSELLREIKSHFPELIEELNKEQGQLCFELGVIAKFTMQKIGQNERETVATIYRIIEKFHLGGNAKMQNFIDTCYVEDLKFPTPKKRNREWAWEILPANLKKLYTDFFDNILG